MDVPRRPLVSYDDITLPYDANQAVSLNPHSSKPPPAKKRKWNKSKVRRNNSHQTNGPTVSQASTSNLQADVEDEDMEEELSRELTYQEIWDDSALIEAWNAATEEYEAYNGPDKGWKKEPVHKSPLWYNIPPSTSPQKPATTATVAEPSAKEEEADSTPFNFDTFVPSHDPSLHHPPAILSSDPTSYQPLAQPETMVSQDEAFSRALSAMYWGGYWTAMYHCQRRVTLQPHATTGTPKGEEEEGEDEAEFDEDEEGEEEEQFVDTQR